MPEEKTIGVFFGGQSPEHEISIITGEFALAELRKMGHNAVSVYVDRKGRWFCDEELSRLKFFEGDYTEKLDALPEYSLSLQSSQKQLKLVNKGLLSKKEITIDFVFPAFHGLGGEDGTVQGLCEFFNVPYAGCGIYASSIAVDKAHTKKMLRALNIPTTDFCIFTKDEWEKSSENIMGKIKEELTFPVFAKPARSGSSIGISKIKTEADLEEALNLAFYYDTKIVVENGVENIIDLTCAVLSNGTDVQVSHVQESLFESDLFDYSVKYLEDGGAQTGNAESNLVIPANISEEDTKKVHKYSKQIFAEMGANGTARVDFLMNRKTGELFANEINTLPGTLYHHLWEKTGVHIHKVLENMLTHGQKRWDDTQNIHTDFATEVLNSANSMKLQNE